MTARADWLAAYETGYHAALVATLAQVEHLGPARTIVNLRAAVDRYLATQPAPPARRNLEAAS